ncbi:transposase [Komagataeibacter medellinensis NBRC 3288]|uniref:Transposase n=1 Tax=Komagataeibacter medellinensis (strain NBRC 3288 / BCRC 11682 / LMG 1693 / Kondo 51) TaxID=634177 RepID=G2I1E3_KOMMN|nr:transposase [Komagataeibacter medellinensis NBRC 3288]
MSGQILDGMPVAAPKQRNTHGEKAALRKGRIPEGWEDRSARLAHKDRHVRWTLEFMKATRQEDRPRASLSRSLTTDRMFPSIESVG